MAAAPEGRKAYAWPRSRGILAAVLAVVVVGGILFISGRDMRAELSIVRSELDAANARLSRNQVEIDDLEDEARRQTAILDSCREAADLGLQVQDGLATLQRGIDRGDEGLLARGLAAVLQLENRWRAANEDCLRDPGGDEGEG